MNITAVLNEIKLNEGLFFTGKYRDKESVVETAKQAAEILFTEEFYNHLMFGLEKTKLRTMSALESHRGGKNNAAYANSVDVESFEEGSKALDDLKKANPKLYNALKYRVYKRATKTIDHQKIVINPKYMKKQTGDAGFTNKVLTVLHEMIHIIQPYTPSLRKVENNIYNIMKEGWNDKYGEFMISRVLLNTDIPDVNKKNEVFTYIVSNRIYTEYLTKKGVENLIDYLKNCGLINPCAYLIPLLLKT